MGKTEILVKNGIKWWVGPQIKKRSLSWSWEKRGLSCEEKKWQKVMRGPRNRYIIVVKIIFISIEVPESFKYLFFIFVVRFNSRLLCKWIVKIDGKINKRKRHRWFRYLFRIKPYVKPYSLYKVTLFQEKMENIQFIVPVESKFIQIKS